MSTGLTRLILTMLVGGLAVISGCSSCQETQQSSTHAPQAGSLHPAVESAAAPASPSIPPPACAVVGAPSVEEGVAPLEIHFTAEGMCTDAEGTFTWDFGDGSGTVEDQNPVHVYQTPGTYTARVTLIDREHDARDTDEAPITVRAR